MIINTRHFGEMQINEKDCLYFDEGIPGFENVKKFILIENEDAESPFCWLQSVDSPSLAFVLINPFMIIEDYDIEVPDGDVVSLGIEKTNEVATYCIVVVPEDITKMTVNLRAPLIINSKTRKGKQVLLENSKYTINHNLINQTE